MKGPLGSAHWNCSADPLELRLGRQDQQMVIKWSMFQVLSYNLMTKMSRLLRTPEIGTINIGDCRKPTEHLAIHFTNPTNLRHDMERFTSGRCQEPSGSASLEICSHNQPNKQTFVIPNSSSKQHCQQIYTIFPPGN